ncbi:APC family permease [Brevibacterium casei]
MTTETSSRVQPHIGLGQGVALYTCATLGAGVLVLPGQVATLAGPASLIAWLISALLGIPLAFTFARLASRFPDAGGVASYAERAFGPVAGATAGWWYFIAVAVGQTIVPLTAGYYLAAALSLPPFAAPVFGLVILALAVAAALADVAIGARVQMGLAIGVAMILVTVVIVSLGQFDPAAFAPFAPAGIAGVGQAVVVLFFAFAGWEAIAHLSAEFRDVRTTLPRATLLTVLIVTVLYLSVATAVVGTGTYGGAAVDRISLGLIVETGWGIAAAAVVAVAAVVICTGTTLAFAQSVSRLGFSLAQRGWAPRSLAVLDRRGVPAVSLLTVTGIGAAGLIGCAVFGWGAEDLVFIPAVLVLATYLIGTAAAMRTFTGRARLVAVLAFSLLLIAVPFAGWHLLVPVGLFAVVAVGLRVRGLRGRRLPTRRLQMRRARRLGSQGDPQAE